ncbi:Protein FAM75D1 [Tupaia chinensis]|uniref:Protein FAM75D1 n=1 Tax=Tupaia chinensis TaxID=246437 RepID=L9KZS2_TUPCH|nr:Protein FAM75D1 [Tupaia chinensis]
MESILFYLKSYSEPVLSLDSAVLAVDPRLTLLSGLGLLLLYLCYLVLASFTQNLRKHEHTHKLCTSCLCSSLGQHHDSTHFRQLLCPDSLCEVCNRSTAEVNRLLDWGAKDEATPSVSSLTSTAFVTEASMFLPSTLSPSPPGDLIAGHLSEPSPPPTPNLSPSLKTPLVDSLSPPPLGDSLPPDPLPPVGCTFPVGHFPSQPPAGHSLLQHHTQKVDPVFHPRLDSREGLSTKVSAIRDLDHSSMAISEFSWWHTHARTMFLPRLPHSNFQEEHVSFCVPETYCWGDTNIKQMEVNSLSFIGLNIQALLERHIKKKMIFQIFKKSEKEEELLSRQMWSDYQMTSSENSLQLLNKQDFTVPQTIWDTQGKPEGLHICQQFLCDKTGGENMERIYSQLFWGLPSLHSESLVAPLLVTRSSFPLELCCVLFNGICNIPAAQIQDRESPVLSNSHPPPITNIHLPILPFIQVHSQAHLQSPLPNPASLSSPQIKKCGVSFHRPQNEVDSQISNENQNLEWHVLQKHQESLWGFVPVLQKCQEGLRPPAPNLPLVSHSSQVHVPVSIFPGNFHVTSDTQEKPELHVPKKQIPHWCLPACRNLGSTALMEPCYNSTETLHQNVRHALSQLPEFQGCSRKELVKTEFSFPGSFHERFPTIFQPMRDMAKNLGPILGKCPSENSPVDSECYVEKDLRATSETIGDWIYHSRNVSGNELLSMPSRNLDQNQVKTILRLHLSRKFWQITAGRIPVDVCRSWLADENVLPPYGSYTNTENTKVAPLEGKFSSHIATLELSFLGPQIQNLLEAHIIRFRVSQRWGLPLKVLESIKFFVLRETKTWPLPQIDFPSYAIHISGVDSTASVIKARSKAFHKDKVGTTKFLPVLDHTLLAISPMDKERQKALRQLPSDTDNEFTQNVQTIESSRQTCLPCTHSIVEKPNQNDVAVVNRCSLELPTKQYEDGHESMDEKVRATGRVEMLQDKMMVEKNSENFPTSNMSRKIVKADELCAFRPNDILKSSKLRSPQMIKVGTSNVEKTPTTEYSPPRVPIPEDLKLSDLKRQLLDELRFKLESLEHSQAQSSSSDTSLSSVSSTSDSSMPHSPSVSSTNLADVQVLHICLDDRGIGVEQGQELWVPRRVVCKCHGKNVSPTTERVSPPGPKAEDCEGKNSGLGTARAEGKTHPPQDRKLEKTSASLSQKETFPPETYFSKKIRQFFQWINSKRKGTKKKSPLQKGKFMPDFSGCYNPIKDQALFMSCGPPEAHELMAAIGRIIEEKLACSQEPEPLELSQQKKEQKEPNKGQSSNYQAPSDPQQEKGSNTHSCTQEAVIPAPSCLTSVRKKRDRIRHPQKAVILKDQLLLQSHCSSEPSREPASHPSPTCMRVCQVPPAAITPAEGTVFSH